MAVAAGRFLDVDGERVHVIQRGVGPPLLLVHGFPSNAVAWRSVMDRLADRYAMTAVDMVGFGLSTRQPTLGLGGDAYADRLAALLDALNLARPHVAGLSWGGSVAQRLALRHPRRVDRLVLVASVSAGHRLQLGSGDLVGLAAAIRFPWIARRVVARFLGRAARGSGLPVEELARGYVDPLRLPGTLAFLRRFVRATSATEPVDVSRIRAPTLVITPQADRIVHPGVGATLAAAIPGARFAAIPDAGHTVQFEAPAEVARLIDGFLAAVAWPAALSGAASAAAR
jgi:pimeloyl-ACP methyl ester carboxylesterase